MATKSTKTYEDSSGKTFSSHAEAAASNTSMGTNPSVKKSGGSSSAPAYNAATGATTGTPSKEYDAYLKSLNTKGSANYVPTPDDAGFENMDAINNAKIKGTTLDQEMAGKPQVNTTAFPGAQNPSLQSTKPVQGQVPVSTGDQYKAGLAATTATNTPAPLTMGEASGTIKKTVPTKADTTQQDNIDTFLSADEGYQSIVKAQQKTKDELAKQPTLVDTYKKYLKDSGIKELDTELLNAKNIIEGTEQDIRNEVSAAGGFATDSQVQALANARNVSLIKNYNNLVNERSQRQEYLTTMMGLAQQDRAYASQNADRQMQFDTQLLNYRDKFVNNTQEKFKFLMTTIGADGVYDLYKNDPHNLNLLEKTVGMGAGSLKIASDKALADKAKATKRDTQVVDVNGSKVLVDTQTGEVITTIGGGDTGSSAAIVPGKKPSGKPDYVSAGFANRTVEANDILSSVEDKKTGAHGETRATWRDYVLFKGNDLKKYIQAEDNFLTAVLRKESGASISPEERENAKKQYFVQNGDTPDVILQKQRNRADSLNSLIGSAGTAYDGVYIEKPNTFKKSVFSSSVTAPDGSGDTIIFTD